MQMKELTGELRTFPPYLHVFVLDIKIPHCSNFRNY